MARVGWLMPGDGERLSASLVTECLVRALAVEARKSGDMVRVLNVHAQTMHSLEEPCAATRIRKLDCSCAGCRIRQAFAAQLERIQVAR